jgi:hypothetical protein
MMRLVQIIAAWQSKGDPDQAIEDFDEAIRLDRKNTTSI